MTKVVTKTVFPGSFSPRVWTTPITITVVLAQPLRWEGMGTPSPDRGQNGTSGRDRDGDFSLKGERAKGTFRIEYLLVKDDVLVSFTLGIRTDITPFKQIVPQK